MIKELVKKHRYPPEGMEEAVCIVITQCELWTDNIKILKHGTAYSHKYTFAKT